MDGAACGGGASQNTIGGKNPGERNIISANGPEAGGGGVTIYGPASQNLIVGNYIGTDINGEVDLTNGGTGIGIILQMGAFGNLVQNNLISGNDLFGVIVNDWGSSYNTIIGNLIGTNADGSTALPNGTGGGIIVGEGAFYNRIGGATEVERNIVSGNAYTGIGVGAIGHGFGTLVLGNFVGTDITGMNNLGNGGCGICAGGQQRNYIGGPAIGEGNVVVGNAGGVNVGGEYNFISGNFFGTNVFGVASLGNMSHGLLANIYSRHNMIGPGNRIAYNQGYGIVIDGDDTFGNTIRQNSIYSNTYMGIENVRGGDDELAPPIITSVSISTVSGAACYGCTVEVFSDAEDEGQVYEGSTIANTTGFFIFIKGNSLVGPYITATATDGLGNTSEFSTPREVLRWVYLPLIAKR